MAENLAFVHKIQENKYINFYIEQTEFQTKRINLKKIWIQIKM